MHPMNLTITKVLGTLDILQLVKILLLMTFLKELKDNHTVSPDELVNWNVSANFQLLLSIRNMNRRGAYF